MNKNRETQISKFLSYVLRHHPDSIGLKLEKDGWASVEEILNNSPLQVKLDELKYVVENNDKRRFSFNDDFTKIKANQGHSVKNLELEFKEVVPPEVLYHGTAVPFLKAIQENGLNKGQRHHVHLSKDIQTATKVGKRHGEVVILAIASQRMYQAGYKFYLSDNEVYLVDLVPVEYLKVL